MKIECVIEGCAKKIDAQHCLCGDHYRMLPEHLCYELRRAFRPNHAIGDQYVGFAVALAKVHSWIRETFGGTDSRPKHNWSTLVEFVRARDRLRGNAYALKVFAQAE